MPKKASIRLLPRYGVRLPPEVMETVRVVAQNERRSMQFIIEDAVTEYLSKYLNRHPEVFSESRVTTMLDRLLPR